MKEEKSSMDRRTFIKTTTLGGASLAISVGASGSSRAAQETGGSSPEKMPTRVLGKTGVSVPILALGGNDWVTNQALLRIAFQMGVTYWDSANEYDNGKCELGIGQYVAKYPEDRKKLFLVTKAAHTVIPEQIDVLLEQSLERMQTDYIDLYSLHGIEDPSVLTPELAAWTEQKKKEGKIRAFGFTAHANVGPLLQAAATHEWIDAVNTSCNYRLLKDDEVQKGLDAIAKANIGFIAMKTQAAQFAGPGPETPRGEGGAPGAEGPPMGQEGRGGGPGEGTQGPPADMQMQPVSAGSEPEDLSAMNHFVEQGYTLEQAKLKLLWEDSRVTTCLSKMDNLTILKANVDAATDGRKLSALDRKVLDDLALNTCGAYCRGCMRCESAMASATRIPDIMRYMMYYNSYGQKHEARQLFRQMPESIRTTLASRDYTRAEGVCPNGIRIGRAMKDALRILA